MTDASISASTNAAVVRRHPIRGILWGLLIGIGLTVVLIVTKVISLDLTMMIIVVVLALLVSVLWSTLGPAKAPKGPPPATVTVAGAPESSRFDDFTDQPAADDGDPSAESASTDDGGLRVDDAPSLGDDADDAD